MELEKHGEIYASRPIFLFWENFFWKKKLSCTSLFAPPPISYPNLCWDGIYTCMYIASDQISKKSGHLNGDYPMSIPTLFLQISISEIIICNILKRNVWEGHIRNKAGYHSWLMHYTIWALSAKSTYVGETDHWDLFCFVLFTFAVILLWQKIFIEPK